MKTAMTPRENQTPTDRKTGMMAKAPVMSRMAVRTRITRKAETVPDQVMMVEVAPVRAATVEMVTEGAEATSSFKNPREIRGDFFILVQKLIVAIFMFFAFTTLVITVTGQTGVVPHRGGMAGATGGITMIGASPFFVHAWLGVRDVKAGRDPGCS